MSINEIISGLEFTVSMFNFDPTTGEEIKSHNDMDMITINACKGAIDFLRKNTIEQAIETLINNGKLFFKDYEGKISPISYCNFEDNKTIFME